MKKILSKQSQRFLTTLEYLYYHDSSTLENLASISNITMKTIKEDINKLNHFIAPLQIDVSEANECILINKNNTSIDFIYSSILSESVEFSTLEMIFYEKENRLEDYADSLFISLSTLKRIISRINKEIKKHGFEISTNPIQLVGNEQFICRTMVHFFREKYLNKEYQFVGVKRELFNELVIDVIQIEDKYLNFPDIETFSLNLYISLIRMMNGHHYQISYMEELEKKYDFLLLSNQVYIEDFKELFGIELTKQKMIELCFPMSGDDFAFDLNDINKTIKRKKERLLKYEKIVSIVNDISKTVDNDLTDTERESLIVDLFNIRFRIDPSTYIINNFTHRLLMNLSQDFPLVFHFLYTKITSYVDQEDYSLEEIEEVIYMLITHWENLLFDIQNHYLKYKVGVYMSYEMEHTSFIIQILNHKFNNYFIFEQIIPTDHDELLKKTKKYDMVITNAFNLQDIHKYVITIELYPSMANYNEINKMYYELSRTSYITFEN